MSDILLDLLYGTPQEREERAKAKAFLMLEGQRFQAACAAMTGMLAASAFPTTDECRANVVAHSRRYADDLLAALARKDGGA